MDDIAEKSRRNLMMLATGIIVVWLLGIPLEGHLVGAVRLDEVQPYRAWLCATGALGYFFLRYHLEPKNAQRRSEWKMFKAKRLATRFSNLLNREYARREAGETTRIRFAFPVPSTPENVIGPMVNPGLTSWDKGFSKGRFQFNWVQKTNIGGFPANLVQNVEQCEFSIPAYEAYGLRLRNTYSAYRELSWNSLEVTLPYVWAGLAALVCIGKAAVSLLYEFPFVRQLLSA